MNQFRTILILASLLIVLFLYKVDFKQDLIWNLKNNLHPKIIFQFKKFYLIYSHDFKKQIILEKKQDRKIISSKNREFKLSTFNNKIFKKNGPKVFLEIYNNNLIAITGTGQLSHTKIQNFINNQLSLKMIRNNLRDIFETEKIIENTGIVLNMKVFRDDIYISYVNEIKKNCFNTSVLKAKLNFKKIIFEPVFSPKKCVKKNNPYGEFYILEAGGALEFIDETKLFLSTGTFRYRDLAQLKDNIFGKILMIDINKNSNKVISMGHRNVQGMFYDKKKDILFSIDHGPQGGDEINLNFFPLNNKLKNYGWPIASYGEHYGGKIDKNKKKYEKAPLLKSHKKNGFIEPHKFFVPSIAPSDILSIPKKFDKNFTNNIYISSLGFKNTKGRRSIHTFKLNSNFELENHEIMRLDDRVRDMEYSKKINSIFLFLEKTASIGILEKL